MQQFGLIMAKIIAKERIIKINYNEFCLKRKQYFNKLSKL